VSGVFVEPDEVTQSDRISHVVGVRERITAERLLEASDKDREGERVEP